MRRSMLFVPGNTPKMMTSCGFFGADSVIFDLEDAVSPTEKDAARNLVRYGCVGPHHGAANKVCHGIFLLCIISMRLVFIIHYITYFFSLQP